MWRFMAASLLQVEHRNKAGGQRLKSLCQSATKRFYVFSNEHHKCVFQYPDHTQIALYAWLWRIFKPVCLGPANMSSPSYFESR